MRQTRAAASLPLPPETQPAPLPASTPAPHLAPGSPEPHPTSSHIPTCAPDPASFPLHKSPTTPPPPAPTPRAQSLQAPAPPAASSPAKTGTAPQNKPGPAHTPPQNPSSWYARISIPAFCTLKTIPEYPLTGCRQFNPSLYTGGMPYPHRQAAIRTADPHLSKYPPKLSQLKTLQKSTRGRVPTR